MRRARRRCTASSRSACTARARRAEEAQAAAAVAPALAQAGPGIRALTEDQTFWEQHAADEASAIPAAVSA